MADQGPQGLTRIIKAAGYSLKGLRAAYINEAAFRQEVWLSVVLIPLGLWLGQGPLEQVLLVSVILLVIMMELINSAIEAIVDRAGTEHNELAGRAKDIGSAAVFVALLLTVFVWGMVLLPRTL